jgi:hypothetical protein
LAPSTELPLLRALPRAWIAFGRAPWRCVGLASLVLLSGAGLAVIGEDLRRLGLAQLGDLAVLLSLLLPLLPLLGLLQLADALLPPHQQPQRPAGRRSFLLRQSLALLLMESLLPLGAIALIQSLSWVMGRISTTLAGLVVIGGGLLLLAWLFSQVLALPLLVHRRCRALQAMDQSLQLVRSNWLKVLALLGLLGGLNLLGLLVASVGLLITLPLSALVLMACCRAQTPGNNDARRNMLPT